VFFLSCKANARVKLAKTGHGRHSSKIFWVVLCIVCFVSFCLLCVCVCVCMCVCVCVCVCARALLPPGGYPIAVNKYIINFDDLLTVHLSTFISVFNQPDTQNLFHNKFYCMPLHVSSTCTHHQEVKIVLHSLWYHHTYRCDDTRV